MAVLVADLLFFSHATQILSQGQQLLVKPNQIVVWVGISVPSLRQRAGAAPSIDQAFPAILDTGAGDFLSIHEQQLSSWGGIPSQRLRVVRWLNVRTATAATLRTPLVDCELWLFRNHPGTRSISPSAPIPLSIDGATLLRGGNPYPRLPLLGMGTFVANRLAFSVDCNRCTVTIMEG